MSDDDLTTDAVPSPPRDEGKKEEKWEEPEINTQPRTKTKKAFRKPKKVAPTAYASVINISNANNIHIGSNYNVYVNKTEPNMEKNHVVNDTIKGLFNSSVPVQRKHLIFLAPHINEEWRNTARALGFSDGQISQFYGDYSRVGIKEVIYQVLLDWIQVEVDNATVGKLSKTLWDTKQEDAVMRWAESCNK